MKSIEFKKFTVSNVVNIYEFHPYQFKNQLQGPNILSKKPNFLKHSKY